MVKAEPKTCRKYTVGNLSNDLRDTRVYRAVRPRTRITDAAATEERSYGTQRSFSVSLSSRFAPARASNFIERARSSAGTDTSVVSLQSGAVAGSTAFTAAWTALAAAASGVLVTVTVPENAPVRTPRERFAT